jgi:hypothetical protein
MLLRIGACLFFLSAAAVSAQVSTNLVPIGADMAVTNNADNGAEVVIAFPDHIAHAWESVPGGTSAFPWSRYTPGGTNLVMGRDANGRILIAWLAKGQLMLMTEPTKRSGFDGPTVLVGGLGLKSLRLGQRPTDGSFILVALTKKGSVVARRQQLANLWEFTGEDDLAGHDLTSISVAATADGSFSIVCTGKDKEVYQIREPSAHADWVGWSSLAGHGIRSTEVATDANGRLQVVTLGADERLYFKRQDANGNFPDWGLVSTIPAGTAFRIGALGNNALTIWGNAVGSESKHLPPHPVFTESGPNGGWADGGTGEPGARVVAGGIIIDANLFDKVETDTEIVITPGHAGDPGCNPGGTNWVDGSACNPPTAPTTTTKTTVRNRGPEVDLIRNGVTSLLIAGNP